MAFAMCGNLDLNKAAKSRGRWESKCVVLHDRVIAIFDTDLIAETSGKQDIVQSTSIRSTRSIRDKFKIGDGNTGSVRLADIKVPAVSEIYIGVPAHRVDVKNVAIVTFNNVTGHPIAKLSSPTDATTFTITTDQKGSWTFRSANLVSKRKWLNAICTRSGASVGASRPPPSILKVREIKRINHVAAISTTIRWKECECSLSPAGLKVAQPGGHETLIPMKLITAARPSLLQNHLFAVNISSMWVVHFQATSDPQRRQWVQSCNLLVTAAHAGMGRQKVVKPRMNAPPPFSVYQKSPLDKVKMAAAGGAAPSPRKINQTASPAAFFFKRIQSGDGRTAYVIRSTKTSERRRIQCLSLVRGRHGDCEHPTRLHSWNHLNLTSRDRNRMQAHLWVFCKLNPTAINHRKSRAASFAASFDERRSIAGGSNMWIYADVSVAVKNERQQFAKTTVGKTAVQRLDTWSGQATALSMAVVLETDVQSLQNQFVHITLYGSRVGVGKSGFKKVGETQCPMDMLLRTNRVTMQTGNGTVTLEVVHKGALLRSILPDINVPMERWYRFAQGDAPRPPDPARMELVAKRLAASKAISAKGTELFVSEQAWEPGCAFSIPALFLKCKADEMREEREELRTLKRLIKRGLAPEATDMDEAVEEGWGVAAVTVEKGRGLCMDFNVSNSYVRVLYVPPTCQSYQQLLNPVRSRNSPFSSPKSVSPGGKKIRKTFFQKRAEANLKKKEEDSGVENHPFVDIHLPSPRTPIILGESNTEYGTANPQWGTHEFRAPPSHADCAHTSAYKTSRLCELGTKSGGSGVENTFRWSVPPFQYKPLFRPDAAVQPKDYKEVVLRMTQDIKGPCHLKPQSMSYFSGSQVVNWLLAQNIVASRQGGVVFGMQILTAGLICHINRIKSFVDSTSVFYFCAVEPATHSPRRHMHQPPTHDVDAHITSHGCVVVQLFDEVADSPSTQPSGTRMRKFAGSRIVFDNTPCDTLIGEVLVPMPIVACPDHNGSTICKWFGLNKDGHYAGDVKVTLSVSYNGDFAAMRKATMGTFLTPMRSQSMNVMRDIATFGEAQSLRLADALDQRIYSLSQMIDEYEQKMVEYAEVYSHSKDNGETERYSAKKVSSNKKHKILHERGCTFRPSTEKKVFELDSVPINLHTQLMNVITLPVPSPGKTSSTLNVYPTISMGAPSAHRLGFSRGGLSKQILAENQLITQASDGTPRQRDDDSLRPNRPRASTASSIKARADSEVSGLDNNVRLSALMWSPLLNNRINICMSQALAAATAAFTSNFYLLLQANDHHRITQLYTVGYLVQWECLLSTHGSEMGMIEDAVGAVSLLDNFRFRIIPLAEGDMYRTGFEICQNYYQVVVSVPELLFTNIPLKFRRSIIRIIPTLFQQGLDAFQTLANKVGSSLAAQQHYINQNNMRKLLKYSALAQKCLENSYRERGHLELLRCRLDEISSLEDTMCELVNKEQSSQKNYDILLAVAPLVRLLSGGRITCCKSGKDRTAMSVTLEQSSILVRRHLAVSHDQSDQEPKVVTRSIAPGEDDHAKDTKLEEVLRVANLFRLFGVRLSIVKKNVGVPQYNFNVLQRQMLPKVYRPPLSTIQPETS